MKHGKLWSAVLSAAMVMGTTVPILAADMDGKLVVIHTNDIHGYYATAEESVGIAGVAALKDYYEAQGADVVLLDTAAVLKAADIPIIDANVLKKGTNTPFFEANTIVETNGMKVGIFGLDTAETRTKSSPSSVKDLTFLDGQEMFDCAQAQVDALEAEGCDYIIALTHLGVDDESTGRRSTDLAEAVDGIDLIVDGHSHTVIDGGQMVGDTMIVSTGSYLANVGTVVVDKATGEETAKLISAADYAANYGTYDEKLAKMVAADQAEVDGYYSQVFATTKVDLNGQKDPGVRTEETNLGDFTADAYLYAGREYVKEQGLDISVDVALSNGGGIRASVPAGEITMNDLYTVFPYGNTVALVTITGEQLLEVLEASTFCTPTAIGGFPQIAGAEYTVNTAVPYENGAQYPDSTYYAPANPGSRVTITSIGGKPFDPKANYTVAVNSFQAEGGDTYYVLTQGSYMQDTGIVDAEALISYVDSLGGVIDETYAEPQDRIKIVSKPVENSETTVPEETTEPEVEAPKTEAEVSPTKLYTVVAGDSLWKIAQKELGNGSKWKQIYETNKKQISNPNRIYVGQELVINQ